MRFIQKSFRIFFVSYSYYFMPYTSLALAYFYTESAKRAQA